MGKNGFHTFPVGTLQQGQCYLKHFLGSLDLESLRWKWNVTVGRPVNEFIIICNFVFLSQYYILNWNYDTFNYHIGNLLHMFLSSPGVFQYQTNWLSFYKMTLRHCLLAYCVFLSILEIQSSKAASVKPVANYIKKRFISQRHNNLKPKECRKIPG